MKNGHRSARSSSSSSVARMIGGKPKTIISPTTSIAHAYTGILSSDMPGARVRMIPTMSSIAPAIAEISMKPMPSSHQSAPLSGEYWELVSGGYMNQPPSGETPKKRVQKNASPPIAYAQKA